MTNESQVQGPVLGPPLPRDRSVARPSERPLYELLPPPDDPAGLSREIGVLPAELTAEDIQRGLHPPEFEPAQASRQAAGSDSSPSNEEAKQEPVPQEDLDLAVTAAVQRWLEAQVADPDALPVDIQPGAVDAGVTVPQNQHYTPEQRSLTLAAVERYGQVGAESILGMMWDGQVPTPASMWLWKKAGVPVLEEHQQFWANYDSQQRKRLSAAIEPRVYSSLRAHDKAVAANDHLGAQRYAISAGIFTDKLAPPSRGSGAAPLVGNADVVQMLVVSPAEVPGTRRDRGAPVAGDDDDA